MLLSGFVIALLAALPLTAHAAAPDAAMPSVALARRIDADVTLVLHYTETPGATILILKDGRPLYAHAYGFRSLADHQPAHMDTHYEIGSITKQFTAAAILQLRDAGKLIWMQRYPHIYPMRRTPAKSQCGNCRRIRAGLRILSMRVQ